MTEGQLEHRPLGRLRHVAARLAAARWWPLYVAVVTVVMTLPSLGNGWILDDYYHRTVLLGRSRFREAIGPPAEMFRFFRGDPNRTWPLIDLGLLPWWTDPTLKAEFLQALTVLTHRLDYALWPDSPAFMHAHSLLWLGCLAAAAAALYRQMLGPTTAAAVAALVFALDDARGATVGFIANRNVIVAATFGVSALLLHDRWRRRGSRPAAVLAPLLLAAALFSKEEGVGTCAYFAAYALFLDPRGCLRGCVALGPAAVSFVTWVLCRASWGYGVRDMGLYIDPVTDTARYLAAAADRLPIQFLGLWSPIPADLATVLGPSGFAWLWRAAIGFIALLLLAMAPLLRRDPLARFWAAGMALALIPVAATLPMDRLLTFAGVGAAGLMAQYWQFVFGPVSGAPTGAAWRLVATPMACFLVVVHLVLAPIALPMRAAHPLGPRWIEHRLYVTTPFRSSLEGQTVVIVNAPSAAHANYLVLLRELEGQSLPAHVRTLAPAIPHVTIRRLDDRTLNVRPAQGYLRFPLDRVFRSERKPFRVGDRVTLTGMTVTITSLTDDGRPADAMFRFDVPLESPSLVWLCFRGSGFESFGLPAVGEEVEIGLDARALLLPESMSRHH